MSNFCRICNNLVTTIYASEELKFKCMSCYTFTPFTDDDSLRYEKSYESNVTIYEKILNNAVKDPASLKARIKCVKCDNDIVKQVRIGKDLKLFNICTKCETKWLY